jgi:YVTN family beta-propeller protein
MKKFFSILFLFFVLTLGLGLESCGSAGGETPSAEIPAPVSHLSISSPDELGEVRITADAGFADIGSTVTISNPSAQFAYLDWLIRKAYAHATHTVTANADGSFQETIEGIAGDVITVTYTTDGVAESVDLTTPENTPPLPATAEVQDVSIDPTRGKALVVANDGSDGFVHVIDIADKVYESTITLPGASGAALIATDPTTGDSIVIDTENITATHVTLDGGGSVVSVTDIIASTDVASGPAGGYMMIAHSDPSPALSFFDLSTDSATAIGDSETEEGTDQDTAFFVATDFDGTNDKVFVLSRLPDGSLILTSHIVDETLPSITQDGAIVVSDVTQPGGLAVFALGAEALITSGDNDMLMRVLLADGSVTSIDVGDDPQDVVVDETADQAYVVNNGDRSVAIISLASNTVSSTVDVGLSPTQVAIDPTGVDGTVIVLNTGDETVTVIE